MIKLPRTFLDPSKRKVKTLTKFIDSHPDTTRSNLTTNISLALIEIAQIGGTTMTYERPDIQLLYALHAPGDQSISAAGKDLRARESKKFTDSNAGRDPLNLSDVSKQVALPTSARQAHWVFRDSRGKGIKGYVKEGVSQVLQNNCKLQTQPKKRREELPRVPRSKLYLINLRSTLPRAAHSASNPPKVGKGNGVDITGWLVSPGVRSIYTEEPGA